MFLGALMFGLSGMATAEDVQWRSDLRKAALDAEKSGKPLLLKFTADWCGYCQKMQTTTFRDARITKQVNSCFVPVTVDADRNERLKDALQIEGLPTTVVISPKFVVMKKIVGYQTADELGKHLDGICPKQVAEKKVVQKPIAKPQPPMQVVKESKPARVHIEPETAFDGYCLVSMLNDRKLRKGNPAISLIFRGRKVTFSSTANRDAFRDIPRKYWPGNAGNCAVTERETGRFVEGNPKFAAIYRERIWFFENGDQRQKFAANPASFVATQTAERN